MNINKRKNAQGVINRGIRIIVGDFSHLERQYFLTLSNRETESLNTKQLSIHPNTTAYQLQLWHSANEYSRPYIQ